jgi:hypothetical protein
VPGEAHRAIEAALDRLPAVSDPAFPAEFDRVFEFVVSHYWSEDAAHPDPRFAKMREQHREVEELGTETLRSLEAGQMEDAARLRLRFLALARHNMIEEERDVFPYYHQE